MAKYPYTPFDDTPFFGLPQGMVDTKASIVPPEGSLAEAGQINAPKPTPGGYPNVGLSVATPVVAPTVQPKPTPAPVTTAPEEMAKAPRSGVPVSPDRFSVKLGNGMTYTSPGDRRRTFTMGTPGQDGFGTVTALGRTGPIGNPTQVGTGLRTTPVAASTPVAQMPLVKSPLDISIENLDRINGVRTGGATSGMPQYLGPESGLGWKTRLGIFKEQMDAYKQNLANAGGLQVAGLRESGDMTRAGIQAASAADQTAAVRERTGLEGGLRTAQAAEATAKATALQQLNAAGLEVSKYQPGTPEYAAAVNRYQALDGKLGTPEKPIIQMQKTYDKLGNPTGEVPIQVIPGKGFQALPEVNPSPEKQARGAFQQMIQGDAKLSTKFASLKPEQQEAEFQKYLQSLQKG